MEIKYISPIGELIYPHINREDLELWSLQNVSQAQC